jgi:hypothetical protein
VSEKKIETEKVKNFDEKRKVGVETPTTPLRKKKSGQKLRPGLHGSRAASAE